MTKKISKKRSPKLKEETFQVVGIRHRLIAQDRRALAKQVPLVAALKREHRNPIDENAIAVYVIDPRVEQLQLGYLRRQVAEVFAPAIDAGELEIESAVLTEIDPEEGTGELTLTYRRF